MLVIKRLLCLTCMMLVFLGLCIAQAEKDYISPNIGMLKFVPAGSFQRDTNPENISTVSEFYISEKEITRAQYISVMGIDQSYEPDSTGMNDPVQCVSWYDAVVFCNKLSMLEGLKPVYTINSSTDPAQWGGVPTTSSFSWNVEADWLANGYRLPTEMEWMWAAMGAEKNDIVNVNTKGYIKAFAGNSPKNKIDDYVWYKKNSSNTTHPVGTKLPNELGLYDMSGNFWEWCWDLYSELYPTGNIYDFTGASSGDCHVLRGGSYYNDAYFQTIAFRYIISPYLLNSSVGIRIVRR